MFRRTLLSERNSLANGMRNRYDWFSPLGLLVSFFTSIIVSACSRNSQKLSNWWRVRFFSNLFSSIKSKFWKYEFLLFSLLTISSSFFLPMWTGTYQPSRGQAVCRDCPAGYYCTSKVENLVKCPPKHYCPVRTEIPVICPNGTYTNDTAEGLERADDCRPCPSGSYCKSGKTLIQ